MIFLQVIVFDEEHEKDLENDVNEFLSSGDYDIIDIKYSIACSTSGDDQIYCFSAMVIYYEK